MEIKTIVVGPIETNCYIIIEDDRAIVIDPGEEAERILKELGGLKLEKIVLTHLHFDHIIAASKIKASAGAKIYCHKDDLVILDEKLLRKSEIDGYLENDQLLPIFNIQSSVFKNIEYRILNTPGHTPGSICLYCPEQKILFSGDTIFAGSIGVTHFKGGDFEKIKDSIENKLLTLPDDVHVYPGHGRDFMLGDGKEGIKKLIK